MKGMNIMDKLQDIVDILHMYNQEHIVNWLNKLDEVKQRELIEQINNIDFENIENTLEIIGKNRGCLIKGGIVDYDKVNKLIVNDVKNGHIKNITFDRMK